MGQTREQRVGGIKHEVAWLTWRERLSVLRALLTSHATDEHGKRVKR